MKNRFVFFCVVVLSFILFSPIRIFAVTPLPSSSYNVSFPADPVILPYPNDGKDTMVEAYLWRDGDYTSLKEMDSRGGFEALWRAPGSFYAEAQGYSYLQNCPGGRKDLPCIRFVGIARAAAISRSYLSVTISYYGTTLAWNSVDLLSTDPFSVTPAPTSYPHIDPIMPGNPDRPTTPERSPITSPRGEPRRPELPRPIQTPNQDLDALKQKVVTLEEKLADQNKRITEQQSLLERVREFLSKFFRWS